MSRNNKNARKMALARDIKAMHLSGKRGPKKTTKKHTKKNTWYNDRTGYYRRNEKGAVTKKKVEEDVVA